MPTQQAWKRLAELLVQQRGRIDSNAKRFAATTGLNYRMVYDIEHAKRDNYRPAKLGEIERAYRLRPGTIQDFLAGRVETLEADDGAGDGTASEGGDEIRLVGPVEGLLEEGEELTGWTMALGRQYRLDIPAQGHAIEAVFRPDEGPEDVIEDLRQQLESTLALAQTQARRRSGGRRA